MENVVEKKAGKKRKPNYFYSIIGVALVLFIVGLFGLVLLHSNGLIRYLKEGVNILVEVKEGTEQEAIDQFKKDLQATSYIKDETIIFTPKEAALETLMEDFGEDFSNFDLPNPLYDVITFNVKASFMNSDSLSQMKKVLLKSPLVFDVYYQEGIVEDIEKNLQNIGIGALIISILFIIVATTLIHNTIRLALYSNRFLIKNMELVGASWGFIIRPYIRMSILNGLISSLIAIGILIGLLMVFYTEVPELRGFQSNTSLFFLFLGLILLGALITGFSSYFTVNRYLKMRLDDLY